MRLTKLATLVGILCRSFVVLAQDFTEVDSQLAAYLKENNLIGFNVTASRARGSDDVKITALGCTIACGFLDLVLSGKVSFPGETQYLYQESRYWSQQQETTNPTCRVAPTNTPDVSLTLYVLKSVGCEFAVKSGGHGAFVGASNINGGLAIDLLNMKTITVSADRTQASYGAGNRWIDVYTKLESMGLAVIGGRVADIGVGGLTLGGGISFFSGRFGWACDNVNNYEVVFADGSIHQVSQQSYPDLYFALRGGGNNFGIVTRFDVLAFPQGNMWGGFNSYFLSPATTTPLINALTEFNNNAPSDPYAAVILSAAYVQSIDAYIWAGDYHYGKPVVNPPILQNFTAVPTLSNTLRISNVSDFIIEFNNSNPGGFRQTYWTFTTKNDPTLMTDILSIFQSEVANVKDAAGILPACIYGPVPTTMTSHFTKNGGNALGITAADGPLVMAVYHSVPKKIESANTGNPIVVLIDFSWSNAVDDSRIMNAARNIVTQANATAWARGLGHRYIYQNYASLEQKVFLGYGPHSYEKLLDVSEKYDPKGVFQKLQPGYFKLKE